MGTVERRQYSIMRAFLVVFLAVAVSAEADPYTLGQVAAGATNGGVVTGVDYGHGVVAGVGAVGNGQVAAHVPLTYTAGVPAVGYPGVAGVYGAGVYGAGVYGYPGVAGVYGAGVYGAGVHTYGKREAEPYTLAQVRLGLTHGGVVTNPAVVHAPYAHVGYPYTGASVYGAVSPCTGVYGAGVHTYGKREAEADPAIVYSNFGYPATTYGYAGVHGVPAVTYAGVHGVPAVPAVTYAAAPAVTYAGVPAVAGSAVHSGTTNKLFGHAVAYTPFGATHSANVGVCTNNDGAVVAC